MINGHCLDTRNNYNTYEWLTNFFKFSTRQPSFVTTYLFSNNSVNTHGNKSCQTKAQMMRCEHVGKLTIHV